MRNPAGITRRLLRLLPVLLLLVAGNVLAQTGQNLLTNPGFETGFVTVAGEQPRSVANGWTPWNAARTASMPSFQNAQPKYIAASAANAQNIVPRVRSGNDAQIYYSFFETHDGGVYQQVSGITPGTELRFSIYAHVWSSTFEDFAVSEEPGDVALRVGIDPTGGTDGLSSNVVYTEAAIFYDTYRQYSIIATAQSSTVTVFVRSTVGDAVWNSYVYLDDAELTSTSGGGTQPTATTVPPTATTAAPTATTVPPTATTGSVAATATTVPPTATTGSVAATATTSSGSTDSTPTREGSSGGVPTATSFQISPTATTRPATGGNNPPISEEFPGTVSHVVQSGDTVGRLAVLYGSSVSAIITANGLDENALIRTGQSLVIPVRIPNPATETPSPTSNVPPIITATPNTPPATGGPTGTTAYVVQPGDTLSTIARRFNTTIDALIQLNGIANPNRIFAGQRLNVPAPNTGGPGTVPTSPPVVLTSPPVVVTSPPVVVTSPPIVVTLPPVIITSPPLVITATQRPNVVTATPIPPSRPTTYTVQPGDNLYRISLRFGVSMVALAQANNITNYNFVFTGQVLTIP